MFKVGDTVVCINKRGNLYSDLVIGREYIIREIVQSQNGTYKCLIFENSEVLWSDFQFKLVAREEKDYSKIKKYGIVKFIEGSYK